MGKCPYYLVARFKLHNLNTYSHTQDFVQQTVQWFWRENYPDQKPDQEPEPSQATGMALARCILGKFLGVGCHFFPPPLDVPTFSAWCLHVQRGERPPAAEGGTLLGREMFRQICPRNRFPRNSRDFLHAVNLRHVTDGFTSLPKEGVLRIFSPLKIRRLQPSLNPRTWVPEVSNTKAAHGLLEVEKYICAQF
jgi:hypothetical protein